MTSKSEEVALMEQFGLSEVHYDQRVKDTHMDVISHSYCEKWRLLYSHLELAKIVVSDAERNPGKEVDKRTAFFSEWRERKGHGATYLKLVNALLKIGHKEDAEKVCKLLAESTPRGSISSTTESPDSVTTPTKASFPYLLDVPKRERQKLEVRLRRESEEMIDKFAMLVYKTTKSLNEQNVPSDILEVLFKNSSHFAKIYNAVKGVKNLNKFILKISDYWSFFDYASLGLIINCQCKHLGPDLKAYEDSFKLYCRCRLCEIPEDAIRIKAEEKDCLCLKCDENFSYKKSKLWDVKTLTDKLSKILDTKLVLRHIKKGCIELTVEPLSDVSFPLSIQQKEQLKHAGVVRLTCLSDQFSISPQHAVLLSKGFRHILCKIFLYLDVKSLCRAEQVCSEWYHVVAESQLWKKVVERRVSTDSVWRRLSKHKKWGRSLFHNESPSKEATEINYKHLFQTIQCMQYNWKKRRYKLTRIQCYTITYCLQFDDNKIVSGHKDNTIKIWECESSKFVMTLQGHTGPVLCLQYDDNVIISGSVDCTIRIWDICDGKMLNTLNHHKNKVLDLKFNSTILVTSSKDHTIAVWERQNSSNTELLRVLEGHISPVKAVELNEKYIVSASGDPEIKIWRMATGELIHTLRGHRRSIGCLCFRGKYVISGSADKTIRLWDVENGMCVRILEGHRNMVRSIGLNNKWIVSGDNDGAIKVWDFEATLDPDKQLEDICLWTSTQHTRSIVTLQFDDSQIVSGSDDDTMLIWDFLDVPDHLNYPQLTPTKKIEHKDKEQYNL